MTRAGRTRARGPALCLGAVLLMVAMSLAACSSEVAEPPPAPPAPPPPVTSKAPDNLPDHDRIQVQTTNLALPYDQLGELDYAEPFSPRAIDDDYIDDRLRTMAIQKWGGQVDAIIEVKTALSGDGSEVSVTAEAVKVRGDCAFCRHRVGSTIAKDQ